MTSNFINILFSKVVVLLDNTKALVTNADRGLGTAMLRILNNTKRNADALNLTEYYQSHSVDLNATTFATADNDDIIEEDKAAYGWSRQLLPDSYLVTVETSIYHYFLQPIKMLPPALN